MFDYDSKIIAIYSICIFTVLMILGQFDCHTSMIMRWYTENPIDGHVVARSISVGLPPEDTNVIDNPDNSAEPQVGHAVPEADREVQKKPLQVKRYNSIEGIDHNEEREKYFFNQLIESVRGKIIETEKSEAIVEDY